MSPAPPSTPGTLTPSPRAVDARAEETDGAPASKRRPTTSCIVDHYNYGRYAPDALRSALEQTVPFDEIVFVDDGSTDGSTEELRRECERHDKVRFVGKPNGGQLSCFNEGFAASSGEIVFFLDADDELRPGYVETALAHYERHPRCDFVACAHETFGAESRVVRLFPEDRDLGFSAVMALGKSLSRLHVSPTSTLSMRRAVLDRILPIPFLEDWRVRADDCLTYGAALAGARKWALAEPLVRYRVHGENLFYGRAGDRDLSYRRHLAVQRLFEHLRGRLGLGPTFAALAPRELDTYQRPPLRLASDYAKIVLRSELGAWQKVRTLKSLATTFARKRFGSDVEEGSVPP